MEAQALRELQAPLKDRYRNDPASALVTLRAAGELTDGISCSVDTGRAIAEAGLHPGTGGDGSQLCSGDMLLQALAACVGVTLRAVATSMGVEVRGGSVRVEGDLDFRGTLGVEKTAPVGFQDIRVSIEVDAPEATDEVIETLERLTMRYCVVYQSLAAPGTVSMTVGRPPLPT